MSRLLGPVRQNGYVVRDIEKAMKYWAEVMGVGPWYYIAKPPIESFEYRGLPSEPDISIALANSGPLQIELIQQRNDAPSMYRDFLEAGHEGLQHIAYWTTDFDASLAKCLAAGYRIGHRGQIGARGRFLYFESDGHPGTVIELSEIAGNKGKFFEKIAREAATWDGSNPIRRL
ncbi:MAG: VOC family protein [Proteobacteria bacterium]|nr:VOC family protein [Pseudomonadota bacterium]